jgi:signal transduction histidine kinase
MKIRFIDLPSTRVILRYSLITVILVIIIASVLPYLLNYPPMSINTEFDVQMSFISYTQQLSLICVFGLLSLSILIRILLKEIDDWHKLPEDKRYENSDLILKVRKKCFDSPYKVFLVELLLPILVGFLILLLTGSHHSIMIYKIFFILTSVSLILSVTSYVFSKDLYYNILARTYKEDLDIGYRVSIKSTFFIQIIPLCLVLLFVTSLIGYSRTIAEKEEIMFQVYSKSLSETFSKNNKQYSESEIIKLLNSIYLYDNTQHRWFIIKPDDTVITSDNSPISHFIIEYTKQISPLLNGKTYDSYGVDTQGSTMILNTAEGSFYVGIIYNIASGDTLNFFVVNFIFLLLLVLAVLYMVIGSVSKDLSKVSKSFTEIYQNQENIEFIKKLPVTSNDEIGDLIKSFNKIQDLTRNNIEKIHSSQEILIEKERLVSLGQMIGGIAHNLKTPIMSISGAAEGLSDLISEYNNSIEDEEVTIEDHHSIANDMTSWVEKIKDYTGYMSDVITAVKGQAVALSGEEAVTFSIDELVKRVNILMKHELKNSLTNLICDIKVDSQLELEGNVNSLVQVINNMISNAIQCYQGEPNKNIDLSIYEEKENIVISIKDYGPGLPKEIQDKLFKEMVTTKGKNGTGLGLFMSYSNIRAHFNGTITFDSKKDSGTTFYIVLPLNKQ